MRENKIKNYVRNVTFLRKMCERECNVRLTVTAEFARIPLYLCVYPNFTSIVWLKRKRICSVMKTRDLTWILYESL